MRTGLRPRLVSTSIVVAIFIQMTVCLCGGAAIGANGAQGVLDLSPAMLLGDNQTIDPGVGTLRIVSGTGSFSSASASEKSILVVAGSKISGKLTVNLNNTFNSSTIVPLVFAPSWGGHESSYRTLIPWISSGISNVSSGELQVTAPSTPGTYYLILAFSADLNGAQVASGTDLGQGAAVWNDGNDLADINASQAVQSQSQGWANFSILSTGGYRTGAVASDVIIITVTSAGFSFQQLEFPLIIALLLAITGMFLFVRKGGRKRAKRMLDSSYLEVESLPPFAKDEIVHELDESKLLLEKGRYGRSERNTRQTMEEIGELNRTVALIRTEMDFAEKLIGDAKDLGLSIDAGAIGLKEVQTQLGGK